MLTGSLISIVQFFATPWTIACQAPLPMEFSRQDYYNIMQQLYFNKRNFLKNKMDQFTFR